MKPSPGTAVSGESMPTLQHTEGFGCVVGSEPAAGTEGGPRGGGDVGANKRSRASKKKIGFKPGCGGMP